jgi:hypothetical protein
MLDMYMGHAYRCLVVIKTFADGNSKTFWETGKSP